jgi:hypothetical protein
LQEFKAQQTDVINIKFSDGDYYCKQWATDYALSNMYVYMIALVIAFMNLALKVILRYITYFEKPRTTSIRSLSIMLKTFIV